MIGRLHAAIEHLHRMPHPVVGRVHGAVAGFGLSLMNACDLVVAADDSLFRVRLPADRAHAGRRRLVVAAATRRHAQGDGDLSAGRALRRRRRARARHRQPGRAARPSSTPRPTPSSHALATGPVLALRNAKRLVRESLARTLSEQLDAEAASFAACAGTADFVEGITAFLAKRPPQFGRVTMRPDESRPRRQDAVHHRRLARHRPRDRAARRARRRQRRHRREDGRTASEAARDDSFRRRRDRRGRRPRAADRLRHPRRGRGRRRRSRRPRRDSAASTSSSTTRARSASPAPPRRR